MTRPNRTEMTTRGGCATALSTTTNDSPHFSTNSATTSPAPPPLPLLSSMAVATVSPLQQSRVGRDTQRYDDAGCRLLACAVIVRQRDTTDDDNGGDDTGDDREVLLISSSKHAGEWILPKGGWEQDETLEQCALREAEEEAGVAGAVVRSLGEVDFVTGKGKPCRLHGFELSLVHQYDQWAEQSRQRQWMNFHDARELLRDRPELVCMLADAEERRPLDAERHL